MSGPELPPVLRSIRGCCVVYIGRLSGYITRANVSRTVSLDFGLRLPWTRTPTATSDWAPRPLWLLPFAMEATTRRGFRLEVACGPSLAMARTRPSENNAQAAFFSARTTEIRHPVCRQTPAEITVITEIAGITEITEITHERESEERKILSLLVLLTSRVY